MYGMIQVSGTRPYSREFEEHQMSPARNLAFFLLCCTLLILTRGLLLTNGSIDFASHLAVVNYINTSVDVPHWKSFSQTSSLSYLGLMFYYPPIAHAATALLSSVLKSDFYAMNSMAVLAIFAFYAITMFILVRHAAIIAACTLSLTIIFLTPFRVFHGAEVFGNFFFAQIFGTSALMICLYYCVCQLSGWFSVVVACIMAYALGWTYLLSEVEFSACFVVASLVSCIEGAFENKQLPIKALCQSAVACAVLLLVMVLHPQFAVMRFIALNNGSIEPSLSANTIAITALVAIGLAALTLIQGSQKSERLKVLIIAYVVGICLICLVQYAALQLGHDGSPYAVRKYTFDVFTALALLVAYDFDLYSKRFMRIARIKLHHASTYGIALGLVVTIAICLTFPSTDARHYVVLSSFEKQMLDLELPQDADGHTASLARGIASSPAYDDILNFALDQTVLHVSDNDAWKFSFKHDLSNARYAIVSTNDPLAVVPGCSLTRATHIGLLAIDYGCAVRASTRIEFGRVIAASLGSTLAPQLAAGWGSPEPEGVWTEGHRSTITIMLPQNVESSVVRLTLGFVEAFTTANHPSQTVTVSVDGEVLASKTYTSRLGIDALSIKIPVKLSHDGKIDIVLRLDDAVSPADLGINIDSRHLGLKLASFVLSK